MSNEPLFAREPDNVAAEDMPAKTAPSRSRFEAKPRPKVMHFRVRVHPFDDKRNSKYDAMKEGEAEALSYISKLQGWCKRKGVSILVEKDGVVHSLYECDGAGWKKEELY